MNADVIKVEPPGEDQAGWTMGLEPKGADGPGLVALNRNEHSVVLNLKPVAGLFLVLEIARRSDVLVDKFRAGLTVRLGIDPATLPAIRPELV